MNLAVFGCGGLGREIMALARQVNHVQGRWGSLFYVDDNPKSVTGEVVRVFDTRDSWVDPSQCEIVIAVGEPEVRSSLRDRIASAGLRLAAVVHPAVSIAPDAKVEPGVVIGSSAYISCGVQISENVVIQPHASIGHDCVIGANSVISTFVSLGGGCHVGARTYIGMSVPVKEGTSIGDDVIVGMGSAVFRDIDSGMIALGNPARPMAKNDRKRVFGK